MIHADCPPGVVAGTLDATVHKLRQVLTGYRQELNQAAEAFEAWEEKWQSQQQQIDAHLKQIESRLRGRSAGPALTLVRPEE